MLKISFVRYGLDEAVSIDCHIIYFTRLERGDNTNRISPTDNAVKLFM